MTDRPTATPDSASEARRAAAARLPDRIAFLGFGLIGGSIAMALRDAGYRGQLVGASPSNKGAAAAVEQGTLDAVWRLPADGPADAGLLILAGPPQSIPATLLTVATYRKWYPSATVTDVSSTKELIVARADELGLPFAGGHPMAGRESSGFAAASADLFVGRPWIVVRGAKAAESDVAKVTSLALATGAQPTELGAPEHDTLVAAISHLPLVAAAALVEAVVTSDPGSSSWPAARALAASGWRDMTRLARGDPEMGAGILATNSANVARRLRAYRDAIDGWIAAIEAADQARDDPPGWSLQARLRAARDALEAKE